MKLRDYLTFRIGLLSRRTRPGENAPGDLRPATLTITTSDGYRIESQSDSGVDDAGDLAYAFMVYGPDSTGDWCTVLLPEKLGEEIDFYGGPDRNCERSRFLLSVCAKVLTNYLLEYGHPPDNHLLEVGALTDPLKGWIDGVLGREQPRQTAEGPLPLPQQVE